MRWIAAVGIVAIFAMLTLVSYTTTESNHKLDMIAAVAVKEFPMPTVTTTWKSVNGTHAVTTQQLAGETNSAWAQRHKAAVLAMQVEFPIVP